MLRAECSARGQQEAGEQVAFFLQPRGFPTQFCIHLGLGIPSFPVSPSLRPFWDTQACSQALGLAAAAHLIREGGSLSFGDRKRSPSIPLG